jgi:hypothetical protein
VSFVAFTNTAGQIIAVESDHVCAVVPIENNVASSRILLQAGGEAADAAAPYVDVTGDVATTVAALGGGGGPVFGQGFNADSDAGPLSTTSAVTVQAGVAQLVAPEAGDYLVLGTCEVGAEAATQGGKVVLGKNGADLSADAVYVAGFIVAGTANSQPFRWSTVNVFTLAAGDVITLRFAADPAAADDFRVSDVQLAMWRVA